MARTLNVQFSAWQRVCMRVLGCVLVAASMVAGGATVLHATEGTLGGVREDVREDRSGDSDSFGGSKSEGHSKHDDDSCKTSDDTPWGKLILFGLTAPFWMPHTLLEDDYANVGYFPDYPYADGVLGDLTIENPTQGNLWSGQLIVDDSYNFDQVNRVHSQLRIDTAARFGFEAETTWLHEQLAGHATDELWIGNAALTFRFSQSSRAQFRSGLGMRWLSDDQSTDLGFSFLYGADFFPAGPWVISTVFDTGTLGSAGVLHARATGGVQFHRFEVFGGFDYLRIGHADIAGPVAGVRLWF